jgi:hypothetical protein
MLNDCQFYGPIHTLIAMLLRNSTSAETRQAAVLQLLLYLTYLKNVPHWLKLLNIPIFKSEDFVGLMVQKMGMKIIQDYMCILYQHKF